MLGGRLTNLLSLLSQEEYQTAEVLAAKMQYSTKTVRRLIKELDEVLCNHGAQIISVYGQGFRLEVRDFHEFQHLFRNHSEFIPNCSQDRVNYLLNCFLTQQGYIKVEELCEKLFVSRKTLGIDLKKVEQILSESNLLLERKPYYGMKISGDEFDIRLCMARYNEQNNNAILPSDNKNEKKTNLILECVLGCLEDDNYRISDIALQNLVFHIDIAMQRIESNKYIPVESVNFIEWKEKVEYKIAKKITECIKQYFTIEFPDSEITYIAIHLAGKKSRGNDRTSADNLLISSDINELAKQMIEEIHGVFQIDLTDDLELIMSLSQHLIALEVRLRYGMKLQNPLLKEIRERYSLAYTMAIQACSVLESKYRRHVDSDEIAYIALALELSLERQRKSRKKKKILLVCSTGVGIAKLLEYKMREMFYDSIEEIITCDERSVGRQNFEEIDYIFSTIPIHAAVPVPICEVKAFLDENDARAMRRMLDSEEEQDIMSYYPKELFFHGKNLENKKEVIEYMCKQIATHRNLPNGFKEAVMRREELAQTCMGNFVAMPHPNRVMTEETFVSVCILDKPIKWDEQHQVQAVFLVSVSKKKKKKIQKFYSITAKLMLSQEDISELIRSGSYETLEKLMNKIEKQMGGLLNG